MSLTFNPEFTKFIVKEFFVEESYLLKPLDSNWREKTGYPTHNGIISHFEGKSYLGYIKRKTPTNFIVFDLDVKNESQHKTLQPRLQKIIKSFGNPNLISRSPSGGLHVYYLLSDHYSHQVINYVITQQVKLQKGNIELFPSNNGLRLLGGKTCPWLMRTTQLSPILRMKYAHS